MCTTFFKIFSKTSKIKFVIGFNRDANLMKPTKECHFWNEDPNIVGGKDLCLNGSWMLINVKTGNIAFLTNLCYYGKYSLQALSRGKLIRDFVSSSFYEESNPTASDTENDDENSPQTKEKIELKIREYANIVSINKDKYNPFNLVIGNILQQEPFLLHVDYSTGEVIDMASGVLHGLSNSLFKLPYPKIQRSLSNYSGEINGDDENILESQMWSILGQTGVSHINNKIHEADNVYNEPYWDNNHPTVFASSSQIVMMVDQNNEIKIQEVTMLPKNLKLENIPLQENNIISGEGSLEQNGVQLQKFIRAVKFVSGMLKLKKRNQVIETEKIKLNILENWEMIKVTVINFMDSYN